MWFAPFEKRGDALLTFGAGPRPGDAARGFFAQLGIDWLAGHVGDQLFCLGQRFRPRRQERFLQTIAGRH